jgi:tRNA dimethylallyltransferase
MNTPEPLPTAIFLMGPTASGKTAAAVELVQHLPVEIISVDSALVYRDMNIGTAKPDAATLAIAPHHLLDVIDPTEAYSAAAFRTDALRLMADITQRGRIPLLVGGTMLYFRALQNGLNDLPQADAAVRAELDADIALYGVPYLHQQLAEVDPETAARLSPNDSQRVQRALEIYRISGQSMSSLLKQPAQATLPYRVLPLALLPSDRSVLHQRIATRFEQIVEQGLVNELRQLRTRFDLHPDLPAMRCVGYRQAWQFMDDEINHAQFVETGIIATRQLAKRQLTWLRGMTDNITIDCLASDATQQVLSRAVTICHAKQLPS